MKKLEIRIAPVRAEDVALLRSMAGRTCVIMADMHGTALEVDIKPATSEAAPLDSTKTLEATE